jgi:hypothetical protein
VTFERLIIIMETTALSRKGNSTMEYKSIDGPVFSRKALSPPVINSRMATTVGIKALCLTEPGQYSGIQAGNNVKLRLVLEGGKKRLTCHGMVDWVKFDEFTNKYFIGFGSLSLSDEEFRVLQRSFVEEAEKPVEFVPRVREKAAEVESVAVANTAAKIMRHKAVNFPVTVIEAIDIMRGDTPFSEFVVNAVLAYIKQR